MSSAEGKKCSDMRAKLVGVVFRASFHFAFYFWRR